MKENILPLCEWGKDTKIRLMLLGKTQAWLIEEVKERTGKYFDSGWMQKMLTGRATSKHKRAIIDQVLVEEEDKNVV